MDKTLLELITFLDDVVAQENDTPLSKRGSFIVGEILGDYSDKYGELYATNEDVQKIADNASDIEISNGDANQLDELWDDIKRHLQNLKSSGN